MEYAIQTNHTTPLTSNLTDQLKDNTKTTDTTKVKENYKTMKKCMENSDWKTSFFNTYFSDPKVIRKCTDILI